MSLTIFSGIQPTGRKHLGNYIGAITQYVAGQDRGDPAIYCIVDLHATTVPYDPSELRARVLDTTGLLIAAGLDPERCILFRQGDVAEHTELCWLLTSVTAYGELNRMHQFRDKSAAQRELVSAGLLLYPVLQAADVLAYRADEVPVGEDQREHLELMRDVAVRFNARFAPEGESILVVPEHRIPTVGARVRDLQHPERKMSTTSGSEQGTVYLLDDPKTISKKFKRAVTDSEDPPVIRRGDDKPGVTNLIEILAAVRGVTSEEVEAEMQSRARLRRPQGRGRRGRRGGARAAAGALPRAARGRSRARGDPRRRRREGPRDRRRRPSPTCARRWASARPAAAEAPRRHRGGSIRVRYATAEGSTPRSSRVVGRRR